MLRKFLVGLVFISMTLHSATELGILNQLYQKRHYIARSMGLIVEVPIAMCTKDYHGTSDLAIYTTDNSTEATIPLSVAIQKIELGLPQIADTNFSFTSSLPIEANATRFIQRVYSSPSLSIFHPPS